MQKKHNTPNDDNYLLNEYKSGKEYALTALYNKYFPYAKNFFESDKLTYAEAEDFSQEVFIKIARAILACEIKNFKNFFYTSLLNKKKDIIRKKYRKNIVLVSIFDELFSNTQSDENQQTILDTLAEQATPYDNFQYKELQRFVKECIDSFDDLKRRTIISLKLDGYKEHQIANVLGVNPHTVNSNWGRGKVQLRDCVSEKIASSKKNNL